MSEIKEENQTEKGFENVEEALTKTEQFIEKHQKSIALVAAAIVLVVFAGWIVKTQVLAPKEKEAQAKMFDAQYYFEQDSLRLALEGDGMAMGFLDIIDEYGSTDAGELAKYYAGVCQLNLGQFEEAKSNFKSFSSDDEILNTYAMGLVGDAEVELGSKENAIAAYRKAANQKNEVTAPIFLMKLGSLYAVMGQKAEAKAAFAEVKDQYPASAQAAEAEKAMLSVE